LGGRELLRLRVLDDLRCEVIGISLPRKQVGV
jgi:hypothetical protein